MTVDPHALEALLEKVQRNRDKPRTSSVPEPLPASARAPSFAPPEEDELEADPFGEPSIPPRSPSRVPGYPPEYPAEYAPEPEPMRAAPSNRPKPIITFPPSVPPPDDVAMPRRGSAVPSEVEGSILSAPPAPHATRPIAQVVSRHPASENATFGQLLTRSLALRAR